MKRKRRRDPKGEGLADDLIGDDPTPSDARRFDEDGMPITKRSTSLPAPSDEPTPRLPK